MPTLLQINSNVIIGSTGRIVNQLGNLAIANGWKSYIAYGRSAGESKSKLIKIGDKISIASHYLLSRIFDLNGFGSYFATKKFITIIKAINPDVIHLHNIHGYYINIKLLFEYLSEVNIPIIWTLHDFWPITGHCAAPILFECEKWKSGCNNCPCKNEYPKSFYDNSKINWIQKRIIFNLPKKMTIVPVSNWQGKYISQSYLSQYPINVIHNGVDIDKFSLNSNYSFRTKHNIEDKFIILGVASEWNNTNGFDKIIEFSKKIPNYVIIVLIGVSSYQKKLLPNNVIGLSVISDMGNLSQIYATADLYINIGRYHTFGLVNIESMACGTPVAVLKDSAGEEIISSKTGFIINEINDIIQIIEKVKLNGKKAYINECRSRAINHFNKEEKFNEYIKLYNKVVQ